MKNLTAIFAALACLSFFSAATAQNIVGTALIEGEIVDLYSNNTWQYRGSETLSLSNPCNKIHQNVSFCPDPDIWTETAKATLQIAAAYNYDATNYGQFIVENLGTDNGITTAYIRRAVIQIAATAAGISPSEVEILDVSTTTLDGREAETIIYKLALNGLNVIYINTVLVTEKMVLQAMTYHIGTEISDAEYAIHQQFLDATTITIQDD